jgi:prepilin-type processing-associated H-X9-DG protein
MRVSYLRHGTRAWIAGRIVVGLVCVVALSIVGFVAGLLTGPYILPHLDINVYLFEPQTRVYYWAFLCALGFGLVGVAVLLAITDNDRMFDSSPRRRNHTGLTLLVGLLMLVSLPALFAWAAAFSRKESATRNQCVNNLKQIALALYAYHDEFGRLPPAYVPDENGRPKHSWRVLILPYLIKNDAPGPAEMKRIYEAYDFSEAWDGPHNRQLASRMPLVYGCGADPGRRASNTSYLLMTGEHSAFVGSPSVKLDDIRDGKANTILVVEAGNSGVNWMEPKDYPIDQLRFGQKDTPGLKMGGNHPGGANAAFADGSVRFLHEKGGTNAMLKELGTIDGGEKVDLDRW